MFLCSTQLYGCPLGRAINNVHIGYLLTQLFHPPVNNSVIMLIYKSVWSSKSPTLSWDGYSTKPTLAFLHDDTLLHIHAHSPYQFCSSTCWHGLLCRNFCWQQQQRDHQSLDSGTHVQRMADPENKMQIVAYIHIGQLTLKHKVQILVHIHTGQLTLKQKVWIVVHVHTGHITLKHKVQLVVHIHTGWLIMKQHRLECGTCRLTLKQCTENYKRYSWPFICH